MSAAPTTAGSASVLLPSPGPPAPASACAPTTALPARWCLCSYPLRPDFRLLEIRLSFSAWPKPSRVCDSLLTLKAEENECVSA